MKKFKSIIFALIVPLILLYPELVFSYEKKIDQKIPLDLEISVVEAAPLTQSTFNISIKIKSLTNIRSGKVKLSASNEIGITGPKEFFIQELSIDETISFATQSMTVGEGKGSFTCSLEITTQDNSTINLTKSLYFIINNGQTFYSGSGFKSAQIDSVKHVLGTDTGEEYEKAVKEIIEETIPFDKKGTNQRNETKKNARETSTTVTVSGSVLWTDRVGNTHPVKFAPVEIWDEDIAFDDLLTTVTTDANGAFTATLENQLIENIDVYIKVFSKSKYFFVVPKDQRSNESLTYFVRSSTETDVKANTVLPTFTIPNNKGGAFDATYNAFSVHAALIESGAYIESLTGSALSKIPVEFPGENTTSFYSNSENYLNILRFDRYDWDVLHHEYGHHVMVKLNITDINVGGDHSIDVNIAEQTGRTKESGFNQAWDEGWPTYFAISLQQERNIDIPSVGAGNLLYEDTEDFDFAYGIESESGIPSLGEDNELAVQRILWDLYDSNADLNDELALGDIAVWQAIINTNPRKLYDIWPALISGKPLGEIVKFGKIFAEHKVAPLPQAPVDKDELTSLDNNIIFKWDAHGGGPTYKNNSFTVEFYDKTLNTLLFTSPTVNIPEYVATPTDLKKIFETEDEVKWIVKGSNTSNPITGPYTSPSFSLKAPQKVDVAFIIDDTGSMGEEIGGVRNALLSYLSGFADESEKTFQLITYKDNVTVRSPTNDLSVIQSQVSSLRASGGGDCPENAEAGIAAVIDNMADNGIVFLATDASPRSGGTLANLTAKLKSKGIRTSTILSGDCFSSSFARYAFSGDEQNVPISDNEDPEYQESTLTETTTEASTGARLTSSVLPERVSAVQAFSYLAEETGGLFAFVPEVNSFGSRGKIKYGQRCHFVSSSFCPTF